MDWLIEHLKTEWTTVVKAPALMFVALALGVAIGWLVASKWYETDLQTMRDQVSSYQTHNSSTATPSNISSPLAAAATPVSSPAPAASPTNVFLSKGGQVTPLYALADKLGWPKSKTKLKEIWNGHYIGGEPVPLDGYIYYNSTFDSVTFDYEGKLATGGWVNSQIIGSHFNSDSPAIKTAIILMQSLNINPALQCGGVPAPPPSLLGP